MECRQDRGVGRGRCYGEVARIVGADLRCSGNGDGSSGDRCPGGVDDTAGNYTRRLGSAGRYQQEEKDGDPVCEPGAIPLPACRGDHIAITASRIEDCAAMSLQTYRRADYSLQISSSRS